MANTFTFRFPPELGQRLANASVFTGRSMTDMVACFVQNGLNHMEGCRGKAFPRARRRPKSGNYAR